MGPKVGVSVVIYSRGCVLLGRRKAEHGNGLIGFPGGHLEMGEDPIDCAIRELKEETGLDLKGPYFHGMTNDVFGPDKHYITIFIGGTVDGEPQNLEPDKCEGWEWMNVDTINDDDLFLPVRNFIIGNCFHGCRG